jgi:hypothetical protein
LRLVKVVRYWSGLPLKAFATMEEHVPRAAPGVFMVSPTGGAQLQASGHTIPGASSAAHALPKE